MPDSVSWFESARRSGILVLVPMLSFLSFGCFAFALLVAEATFDLADPTVQVLGRAWLAGAGLVLALVLYTWSRGALIIDSRKRRDRRLRAQLLGLGTAVALAVAVIASFAVTLPLGKPVFMAAFSGFLAALLVTTTATWVYGHATNTWPPDARAFARDGEWLGFLYARREWDSRNRIRMMPSLLLLFVAVALFFVTAADVPRGGLLQRPETMELFIAQIAALGVLLAIGLCATVWLLNWPPLLVPPPFRSDVGLIRHAWGSLARWRKRRQRGNETGSRSNAR